MDEKLSWLWFMDSVFNSSAQCLKCRAARVCLTPNQADHTCWDNIAKADNIDISVLGDAGLYGHARQKRDAVPG